MNLIKLLLPLITLFNVAQAKTSTIIIPTSQTIEILGSSKIAPDEDIIPIIGDSLIPPTSSVSDIVLKQIWATFGSSTPKMLDIAECESGKKQFNPDGSILRGRVDHDDIGFFQINLRYHLDKSKQMGYNIFLLGDNIKYAKYLYNQYGTQPWNASRECWSRG